MSIEVIPGLGPLVLEPSDRISAGRVPYPLEIYTTPLLDLSQVVTDLEIVPARFGYVPVNRVSGVALWVIESIVGTQTTPPTIKAGSNTARTNFFASSSATPSNADVNGANVPSISNASSAIAAVGLQLLPNSPIYFSITSPAAGTGGYKCMARLVFNVAWTAVNP